MKCAIGRGSQTKCAAVFIQHAGNAVVVLGSSKHMRRRAKRGTPGCATVLSHQQQQQHLRRRADNEMLSRLAELVVVDAQGAVQPLEHVDFGDSELFFSGTQLQGLNIWHGQHLRFVRALKDSVLLRKLALRASHLHFKSRRCHIALLHSVSSCTSTATFPETLLTSTHTHNHRAAGSDRHALGVQAWCRPAQPPATRPCA